MVAAAYSFRHQHRPLCIRAHDLRVYLQPEGDAPGLETRIEYFAQGRACYRERRWRDAEIAFQRLLKLWPEDCPAHMYLNRCREYLVSGPEENWDGVHVMTQK